MNCWLPTSWLFFCFKKTPVVESHWSRSPSVQGRMDMNENETTNTSETLYSTRLFRQPPILDFSVDFLRVTVFVVASSWIAIIGPPRLRRRLDLMIRNRRHMNPFTNENRYRFLQKVNSVSPLVRHFHIEMIQPFPLCFIPLLCPYFAGGYQILNTGVKRLVCRQIGLRPLLLQNTCPKNGHSSRVVRTVN